MTSACLALAFWPFVILALWLGLRWRARKAEGLRPLLLTRLEELDGSAAARKAVSRNTQDSWSFSLRVKGRALDVVLTPSVVPPGSTRCAAQLAVPLRGVDQSVHPRWSDPLLPSGLRGSVDTTGLTTLSDVDLRTPGALQRVCNDTVDAAVVIETAFADALSAGRRPPKDPDGGGT